MLWRRDCTATVLECYGTAPYCDGIDIRYIYTRPRVGRYLIGLHGNLPGIIIRIFTLKRGRVCDRTVQFRGNAERYFDGAAQ